MTSGWSIMMTQFMGLEESLLKRNRAGSPRKAIMWSSDRELRMRETPRFLLLNNDQVHWCSQVHGREQALIVKAASAPAFVSVSLAAALTLSCQSGDRLAQDIISDGYLASQGTKQLVDVYLCTLLVQVCKQLKHLLDAMHRDVQLTLHRVVISV